MRFAALPPPKVQRKFSTKHRTIRSKSSKRANLEDRQSTLTQYDFESTPSSGRREINDSTEDEFSDPEPRPRKRKRLEGRNDKEEKQKTLTQMERGNPRWPKRPTLLRSPSCEAWETDDVESNATNSEVIQIHSEEDRSSSISQKVAPGCSLDESQSFRSFATLTASDESPQNERPRQRRDLYRTPRKVRFTEVPSSQTPPSTHCSTSPRKLNAYDRRSPLRERSNNILPLTHADEDIDSQPHCMKLLERVRNAARTIPNVSKLGKDDHLPDDMPNAQDVFDSFSIKDAASIHSAGYKSAHGHRKGSTPLPRRKKLVEYSQRSDPRSWQSGKVDESYDHSARPHPTQFTSTHPCTYDPAYVALSRDADRYQRTQAQGGGFVDDSETDDDIDLDRGCASTLADEPSTERECGDDGQAGSSVDYEELESSEAANSTDAEILRTQILSSPELNSHQPDYSSFISSSPFPMPPRTASRDPLPSSHQSRSRAQETRKVTASQLDALIDFSLPPPPPLTSRSG